MYLELLQHLVDCGKPAVPRGQPTRELLDVQVIIKEPASVHVLETARRSPASIAATEAAHLIAGVSSLEQLDSASGGRFSRFADHGRLRGAYGPRAYSQLERVIQLLSGDPDSRQAAVSIWNGTELAAPSKDVPCTISLHFTIRGGKLLMRTSMRSNDIFLGFPIDIEMFAALQKTVAAALGIPAGQYTHAVGSLHLYDRDLERAMLILSAGLGWQTREPALPDGALPLVTDLIPGQRWRSSRQAVEDIVMFQFGTALYLEEDDWAGWKEWQHQFAGCIPHLPQHGTWQVCSHCRYITDGPCRECDIEPFQ